MWPADQVNEVTVKADQLKFGNPLYFKDAGLWQKVNTAGVSTIQGMVQAINASNAGVSAQINSSGDLVISNAPDRIGRDIRISASPSDATGTSSLTALGLSATTFKVEVKVTPSGPIQLGFGGTGNPTDLAQLGFRTGAYITGGVKDDLLVFVSGPGNAAVSASYSGQPVDAKQSLREQTLEVKFFQDPDKYNGALYYTISSTDPKNTALGPTLVAERTFDESVLDPGIRFQGLNLSFTAVPKPNDVFKLDGNQDGLGNNDNMLAIAALETKAVVGNKTLTNSYIDQVNEMGNIARQATISQTALQVVHDQAIKSRDEISGVSLDKEAADLIRYQQAYQASAKVLQVAGQLFDAVLRV
jgi:flagellar hook-associated protein FlgK